MMIKYVGVCILCLFSFVSCLNGGSGLIQIDAKIEGLVAGDTILFTQFVFPFKLLNTDTCIVEKEGVFSFRDTATQTRNYFVDYRSGKDATLSSSASLEVYIRPNDHVYLNGSVNSFATVQKRGGLFDDVRLKDWETDSELHVAEREEKEKEFGNTVDDSEYAVILYTRNHHFNEIPYEELEMRYERFTPEVKATASGKVLANILEIRRNLQPGSIPPAFTVTDEEGNRLSLSDYRGRYLLIYRWGLCPGTLWVHPQLLDLYEKFHSKGFEVLGFVENTDFLNPAFKETNLGVLFNNPWPTVYTSRKENQFIHDAYYFTSLPILMVISPEGRTLYRGNGEVYESLKNLLEEKLQN